MASTVDYDVEYGVSVSGRGSASPNFAAAVSAGIAGCLSGKTVSATEWRPAVTGYTAME